MNPAEILSFLNKEKFETSFLRFIFKILINFYADDLEYSEQNIATFIDAAENAESDGTKSIYRFVEQIDKVNFDSVLRELVKSGEMYLYWNEPAFGFSFLAFGAAYSINENSSKRVSETEKIIESLRSSVISNEHEFELNSIPLFVGGLKFAPNGESELWKDYSDSEWFIPETIILKTENKYYCIATVYDKSADKLQELRRRAVELTSSKPESAEEFPPAKIVATNLNDESEFINWNSMVKSALKSIRKSEFQKIVLSREVKLELSKKPELTVLLKKLADRYPYCYVYAFGKADSIFIGASPERLAKFSGGYIEADALAGSIPRGRTLAEDRKLEQELLSSEKNLHEQKAVVDFITGSFSSFAEDIEYEEKPIIRKLPNIQHLWTPVKAKLKSSRPIFSLLKEVHPTPAICGAPWSAAMSSILNEETHHRGLFTGAIGWFNLSNEGEFAVAIRSALIQNNMVYAFAGCGIVEGSDPETEFDETKLKLRPILNLFDYEEKDKS